MSMHDTEQVIEDFLGDTPRAAQWRALRQALTERLTALRRQRREEAQSDAPAAARLQALEAQIAALDRQVAALETEEAVSQFVEDSIKVTLSRAAPEDEEE